MLEGSALRPAQDVGHFVSRCVELYKQAHGLTGSEAVRELLAADVLDCFVEFYDIENSFSESQILEDMDVMTQRAQRDAYGALSR